MKRKFVMYLTLTTALALAFMFALGVVVTRSNNYEQAEDNVIALTKVYASVYSEGENFAQADASIRVTVVSATGEVLSDSDCSDLSTLDNHLTREEITAALTDSPKTVIRYSDTLKRDMIYYAEKVPTSSGYVFLRVAVPVAGLNSYMSKTIPLMVLIFLVLCCLSPVLGMWFCDRALKPLGAVKTSLAALRSGGAPVIPATDDADVNKMLAEITDIGVELQNGISRLSSERARLDYLIDNISDGIVLTDGGGAVRLINKNATRIFGVTPEIIGRNADALTDSAAFVSAIAACADGHNRVFEHCTDGSYYLCTSSKIDGESVVTVLSDITAAKNSEKLRGEFFANASHELKTPLTSIKGFNELLSMQNKDGNLAPYIVQIGKESERMLALIDDMLKLSKLENERAPDAVEVDVGKVAAEVVLCLQPLADDKQVTLTACGGGTIRAEQAHIYELIKNLAENAVKYNNVGGNAKIDVADSPEKLTITVADNGIGIESAHQSRIFERFYRVEKSRSRETGGTGLGLAIVKHVCELYGARLTLDSKKGVGTSITAEFDK